MIRADEESSLHAPREEPLGTHRGEGINGELFSAARLANSAVVLTPTELGLAGS